MDLKIVKLNTARSKDRKRFVQVPWNLYDPQSSNWVPPLRLSVDELLNPKHPFYQTAEIEAWIVLKNELPIARIMAIVNHRYNDFHNTELGFFGFFECPNEPEVAAMLFNKVEEFRKSRGLKEILGPVNPSTNYECGLLIDGHDDPPQIMMPYNPPFYAQLIEQNGFSKAKDLLAYRFIVEKGMPEVIQKISQRVEKTQNIQFRQIDKKNWQRDIQLIHEIYNSAWEKNWGFVPMTDSEFYHMGKEMKQILDPRYAIIAEINDEAAGFILTLPDYNQLFKKIPNGKLFPTGLWTLLTGSKSIDRIRTLTLGVKEKYRRIGLETSLYLRSWQVAKEQNMKEAEFSWVLEDNVAMNKPIQRMGAEAYKTYRLYRSSKSL